MPPIEFACPTCISPLGATLVCSGCGRAYSLRDGIYRFLLPEQVQALAAFQAQYRRVREQDGYRSQAAEYYRRLPQVQPGDSQEQTWAVRAATYRHVEQIVQDGSARTRRQLAVLDLGAGSGWLCNRLAALGHTCVAVDWFADDEDGLGAARHYSNAFTRVQADFDRMPLVPGQFDLVIYNASLHYAPNIENSLRCGWSMLPPGGRLAVMDSPTFRLRASGERMATAQTERHAGGHEHSEAIRTGQGYLLASDMRAIGRRLQVELAYQRTHGSLSWALRRWWAGLKLRREPASFGLWTGVKPS